MRISVGIIFIHLSLLYPYKAVAQDGDFSLDVGSNSASKQSDSSSLDDFGSTSNLFGDEPIGSENVEANPAKAGAEALGLGGKKEGNSKANLPSKADEVSKSDTQIQAPSLLKPASPSVPKEDVSEKNSSENNEKNGSASSIIQPVARLVGDGSVAPVKQTELHGSNEFGGVPPLPGTRREMAPGEAPEMYDVEEGDTMFDVCSQLIDDGNYWPKLWSLNPDVRNPHFIYPGMKLAFYAGDDENPPYIDVVSEDEVVPVEKGPIQEAELVTEVQPLPVTGAEGGSVKVERIAEDSQVVSVVGPAEIGADGDALDGFIFTGKPWTRDDIDFVIPAFFFSDEAQGLGEVVGGSSGQTMIGDDKLVMIASEGELGVGTYSILRPSGDVESLKSRSFVGYRYEFAGNVRVTRKTKSGLLEGIVFDTRGGVQEGDIVVQFIATKRNIPSASSIGPVATADSSVIGFQDAGRSSGGKGDLVFLEKTGLSVGGFYSIFRTDDNRDISHFQNLDAMQDGGVVGVARVIEISGESALAYIVAGRSEVRVGDSLSLR